MADCLDLIWFLLLLEVIVPEHLYLKNDTVHLSQDHNLTCDAAYFKYHYMDKSIFIGNDTRNQLAQACAHQNLKCDKAVLEASFLHNGSHLMLLVFRDNMRDNKDCWGYLINIWTPTSHEQMYIPRNKSSKTHYTTNAIMLEPSQKYEADVISLPTMVRRKLEYTSLDECGEEMVLSVYNQSLKNLEEKCKGYAQMETNTANSIATRICYEHPKSFSQRIKLLSTLDCDGKLRPVPSVTYKTKNTQDILYVVLGILVFLLVLAVAVFQMLKRGVRYGKCLLFPRRLKPLQRDECALNDQQKSVLILHRPGCDILEKFIRDFAYVLTVCGVEVKVALLEQSTLDNEGGIASYLQRNLQSCDYIFTLLTEQKEEPPLLKHKPYEFALQIISGIALNTNNCSRYFPLYLSSYQETVSWFPSFLLAAKHKGFKIPDDFKDVIALLSPSVDENAIEKKKCHNHIIFKRMETLSKKYLQESHQECYGEKCRKGEVYISRSNLSSIWPSTINSRCSSFTSIACDIKPELLVNSKLDILSFHKSKQFWRNKYYSYDNILTRVKEEDVPFGAV